jgi:hypothetical protein
MGQSSEQRFRTRRPQPGYNFGRVHKSLANPYARTPAMAAGISDHVWNCEEIAALLD